MKKPEETYQTYKKRVIDPVSPSFCAAKWYNSTIWLGLGWTSSCHHPHPHVIPPASLSKNPSALHNTDHKKRQRLLMQAGIRPPECGYCWKIEDCGPENVSDRVLKTSLYDDADVARLASLVPGADVNPKMLEIAFDRLCNFACSYCNSAFSTKWSGEIRKRGPYPGLEGQDRRYFAVDTPAMAWKGKRENNPYIRAFWKWWPELARELTEIRITGGEPLLSKETWKFFAYFKKHPASPVTLALNSNLGVPDTLIDRLVRRSHDVNRLDLYTSCEAAGAQAEYLRDGLDFRRYLRNVEKILESGKLRMLCFMMTVGALCLFSITDFMDEILRLKAEHPKSLIFWSANVLSAPDFQGPQVLPPELLEERARHLENWLASRGAHPGMTELDRGHVERLVRFLRSGLPPRPREALWKDFKTFFSEYDRRRGKEIHSAFPELARWWDR